MLFTLAQVIGALSAVRDVPEAQMVPRSELIFAIV